MSTAKQCTNKKTTIVLFQNRSHFSNMTASSSFMSKTISVVSKETLRDTEWLTERHSLPEMQLNSLLIKVRGHAAQARWRAFRRTVVIRSCVAEEMYWGDIHAASISHINSIKQGTMLHFDIKKKILLPLTIFNKFFPPPAHPWIEKLALFYTYFSKTHLPSPYLWIFIPPVVSIVKRTDY